MSITGPNVDVHDSEVDDRPNSIELEHATVEANGETECTIYPSGCDETEIVTRWITAKAGSFVALDEMR